MSLSQFINYSLVHVRSLIRFLSLSLSLSLFLSPPLSNNQSIYVYVYVHIFCDSQPVPLFHLLS